MKYEFSYNGKTIAYEIIYKNVKNIAMGAEFSYDYNHRENRLVCSFIGYDSLMVSDDLHSIKWYDGKSRYLGIKRPNLIEASEGLQAIFKAKEEDDMLRSV